MKNIIRFGDHKFEVPGNGINFWDTGFALTFLLGEDMTVDEIEKLISGNTETINLLEVIETPSYEERVVATYKGYSKFHSIEKINDFIDDNGAKTTAIKVTLYSPSLEDKVTVNASDITAINEAIADLASTISESEESEKTDG